MAKLFKDKQIKKELEGFEIPDFEQKLDLIRGWKRVYDSKELHKKSESQCEQAFNDDFFVKILDYVKFPAEKYSIDPKGSTEASGQRPDAILGAFSENTKYVKAVVEIKDVRTPLDKSQRREGNLSPIQQAFKYKPQFKDCAFVIATNFYEIRLFKDNQLDYESFTLDSLVDQANNYYQFRKFYFLLNFYNFVNSVGQSRTEKLLSHIVVEQESITKDFYKHYSALRKELIKDIVKNNKISKAEWVSVVEKAQKLIDRIVFICFCEDLDLLPDGKLAEVIYHTEKLGLIQPVWDTLKGFFRAIDKGSEKLEIPNGYNGELFKEDLVLENLKISDEICKKFVELGHYDFSEDLSVNILGHIFEQSISDVEEIKSVGVDGFEEGKQVSKRKKDGIFYTPEYIVDYIVKNTVGSLLDKKYVELAEKHGLKEEIKDVNYEKRALKVYEEYQQYLRGLKILDPACGSGAFLVKVYDFLYAENMRVADLITDLSGGAISMENSKNYIKAILEDNIYGVDLNAESVDITKLSLWLKTAIKGQKLVSLGNNIKVGNSLIDDPEVAGSKAFKWEEQFKEIMDNGGFDVIVGNPPYVKLQNFRHLEKEVEFLKLKYLSAQTGNFDLYLPFFEKGYSLLRKGGFLSFIAPSVWTKNQYGKGLRDFMIENTAIQGWVDFGSYQVFDDATVYTAIQTLSKQKNDSFYFVSCHNGDLISSQKDYLKIDLLKEKKSWAFVVSKDLAIINKMEKLGQPLGDIVEGIIVGVQTSADKIFHLKKIKNNLYWSDYLNKEVEIEDDIMKPIVSGNNVKRYMITHSDIYVIYPYGGEENKITLLEERVLTNKFPLAYNYLSICSYVLRSREKGKFNDDTWYRFGRNQNIDKQHFPKLMVPRLVSRLQVSIDVDGDFVLDNVDVNGILGEIKSLKLLMVLLNSSLLNYYFIKTAKPFNSGTYSANKQFIYPLPIIYPTNESVFLQKAEFMMNLFLELNEIKGKFLKLINSEYGCNGKKIDQFNLLSFDEFLKGLKVNNLSLERKSDLMDYFEYNKSKINSIVSDIYIEDKKIDDLVFEMYGLTPEEKTYILKVVNSSNAN